MRKFNSSQLLIATNNKGKIKEIRYMLEAFGIEVVSLEDKNIVEPEETGKTFEENALLKAKYYGQMFNMPALADDSGLCIDELDGFPGIYSARYAKENNDFSNAFELIKHKLKEKGKSSSTAYFICALALWWPDDYSEAFIGKLEGEVMFPPIMGEYGFGYSPIFRPNGFDQRYSTLNDKIRNNMSHRALAFKQLVDKCFS